MTLVWRPGFQFDVDASTYIEAVEAADTQALETGVRYAINDFVIGCKTDGIWSAIKASCILAGARTLTGALVPLVGTAPTNFNFVAGDYNRETGLVGDGSTKYLDSNRNNNDDPQNSNHNAVYATTVGSLAFMGSDVGATSGTNLLGSGLHRSRSATPTAYTSVAGFIGITRNNSSNYSLRNNQSSTTINTASQAPTSTSLKLYSPDAVNFATHRIAFYSIGESLDLEKLDTRVTRLMNLITYTQTAGLPDLSVMDMDAAAYIGGAYRAGGTLS